MDRASRKWTAVAVAVALVAGASGGVAVAAKKSKPRSQASGPVDHLKVLQRTGNVGTSDTDWRALPVEGRRNQPTETEDSLRAETIPSTPTVISRGPMTLTVSLDVTGGPVELRVVRDSGSGKALKPGKVRFAPRPGDTSRTFTWVTPGSRKLRCHSFELQWRSVDGSEVRSRAGTLALSYNKPKKQKFGCA